VANSQQQDELYALILQTIEGQISDDDFLRLEAIFRENPSKCRVYVDSVILYSMLTQSNSLFDKDDCPSDFRNMKLWEFLAVEEKTAPAIDIPKEKVGKKHSVKIEHPKTEKQINKHSILAAFLSIAALLFIILYPIFAPVPVQRTPVGVVKLTYDAESGTNQKPIQKETVIYAGPFTLAKGSIEVELDSGVQLVITSPGELVFETTNSTVLKCGSLVARIPPHSRSFAVSTPLCSVVDYGTEFGINVSTDGKTEVEVFKGKVDLRDNPNPLIFSNSRFITAGQIGRYDISGQIAVQPAREIAIENKNMFVRNLPREWTGKDGKTAWNDVSNWSGNIPNLLQAAFFRNMKPGSACVIDSTLAGPNRAYAEYLNVGLQGYGCVEMTGGELETNEIWIGRQRGGQGIFTLTDGTIDIANGMTSLIVIGGAWEEGGGGNGTLNIKGGRIRFHNDSGSVIMGWGAPAQGTLNIENGEFIIPGQLCMGKENDINGIRVPEGAGYVNLKKGILHVGSILITKGQIDIEAGALKIKQDVREQVKQMIQAGQLTGYAGKAKLKISYNIAEDQTIIQAQPD
jgi:hypothetical protein